MTRNLIVGIGATLVFTLAALWIINRVPFLGKLVNKA